METITSGTSLFKLILYFDTCIDIVIYEPWSIGPEVVIETFWPFETISTWRTRPTSMGSGAYTNLLAPSTANCIYAEMKTCEQIIRLNYKLQKEESIPETGSLRLHWEEKRYHWIEHFESSVASSEQDWILKIEPSVSEPINWYNGDLFSSILLLSANCRWWGQKSWIQLNKV